jgi:hypothetical protein
MLGHDLRRFQARHQNERAGWERSEHAKEQFRQSWACMPSKRRPAKRSKGWEASLAHVVTIVRGPTLRRLPRPAPYILKLPKAKQSSHWDVVSKFEFLGDEAIVSAKVLIVHPDFDPPFPIFWKGLLLFVTIATWMHQNEVWLVINTAPG